MSSIPRADMGDVPGWPLVAYTGKPPCDSAMTTLQQGKLVWIGEDLTGPDVEWPKPEQGISPIDEPEKIKTVLRPYLAELGFSEDPSIEFLGAGRWNRVFNIRNSGDRESSPEYVFRISLPVYPWYKTEAEVATIQFVREHTTIPAPAVYAFDSSLNNALGYEWILMEKLPGVPFSSLRDRLNPENLQSIAHTVAEWCDELSRHRFDVIGSFYLDHLQRAIQLGRPVIQHFMADWRHDYCFRRGPFQNIHEYLRSFIDCNAAELFDPRQRLRGEIDAVYDEIELLKKEIKKEQWLVEEEQQGDDQMGDSTNEMPSSAATVAQIRISKLEIRYSELLNLPEVRCSAVDFETDRYRYGLYKRAANLGQLGELLAKCCPKDNFGPDATVLEHWDMSEGNVLIDPKSKKVTGLIDWEQLHTVPLCLINSRYPSIMERDGNWPDLLEPPGSTEMSDKNNESDDQVPEKLDIELFWDKQIMRKAFDGRLKELNSPWLQVGKDSKDEAGGERRRMCLKYEDLCPNCMRYHPIAKAEVLKELHKLVRSGSYCNKRLELIENILKSDKPQTGK